MGESTYKVDKHEDEFDNMSREEIIVEAVKYANEVGGIVIPKGNYAFLVDSYLELKEVKKATFTQRIRYLLYGDFN